MWLDRLVSFVDFTSGNDQFVSMYDSVSDEFCFLMNVVYGKVISECIVDIVCEIFPLSFIVIDESFSSVGFDMFLGYEYCGEYREMIRWELCEGRPG